MNTTSQLQGAAPRLLVTSAPHLHTPLTSSRIMWDVNLALLPALIMSVVNFGSKAVVVIGMSVFGAVLAELFCQKILMKKEATIADGSAVVTGILLAFCLPAALPWWIAFLGGFIAISLGKQIYGGLGQNIFNPALVARAVLLASWPVYMNTWIKSSAGIGAFETVTDAVTSATPLTVLKETAEAAGSLSALNEAGISLATQVMTTLDLSYQQLLLGTGFSGSLGEASKFALIIGGIYLLFRGHITWHAPVAMMTTVFAGALLLSGSFDYALFHLLTGGLMLGAIFMITDMVTSPMTTKGQALFAIGCGALTLLIRIKGGYPEGICYAILIMNSVVPLIDKFTAPRKFGYLKEAQT